MTWGAQVLHVAAKDVRHTKWLLVGYIALVALSIGLAVGWTGLPLSGFPVVTILIIPAGMMLAALVVQTDSPSRVDAFWATRPLSTSAVIAAKAAVVAGVLLIGCVAQWVALDAFSVPHESIAWPMTVSVVSYGVLLCVAMAAAVLTPNLKAFVAVLIVTALATAPTSDLIWPRMHALWVAHAHSGPVLALLVTIGPALVYALIVVYQYATRNLRWGVRFGVLGAAAFVIQPIPGVNDAPLSFSRPPEPSASFVSPPSDSVAVARAWLPAPSPPSLWFRLDMPAAPPSDRVVMLLGHVYLERVGGRTDSLDAPEPTTILHDARASVGPAVQWIAGREPGSDSMALGFPLSDAEAAAIRDGVVRARLVGWLEVQEPRLVTTVPARRGATARSPWMRVQVGIGATGAGRSLVLRKAAIEQESFPTSDSPYGRDAYVLVNRRRGQALANPLPDRSSSYVVVIPSPAGDTVIEEAAEVRGTGVGSLPLPAVSVSASQFSIRLDSPIDADWLRDAELELLTWTTVRRYTVDLVVAPKRIERR